MSAPSKVVVITGATSGVGRAAARAFADRGAHVALLARGREGLDGAAREIEARGRNALPLAVDAANATDVADAARVVEEELGPIDVWVNNAMTTVFAEFVDIELEEFRRTTEVTSSRASGAREPRSA